MDILVLLHAADTLRGVGRQQQARKAGQLGEADEAELGKLASAPRTACGCCTHTMLAMTCAHMHFTQGQCSGSDMGNGEHQAAHYNRRRQVGDGEFPTCFESGRRIL